jgi:diguanylate cyclase (GGDEF)-like protein
VQLTKNKDGLLTEILKRRTNFMVAYVPLSLSFFASPLAFLTPGFAELGLSGVLTPNDLIESIDRKSEICEAEGYKEYKEEVRHQILQMSESSTGHNVVLLPLKIREEKRAFALSVFQLPEEGIIVFVFEEFANEVINLEKLFFSSAKDDLTGLFNLHTFYDHTKKNYRQLYVGLFDINHFKNVNDTFGHGKGDEVLAEIGRRLISIAGPDEIYYHRSGDEFIFLSFVMDRDYQLRLIEKIERELEGIHLGTDTIEAAFGLVKVDHHGLTPVAGNYDDREALLFADVAMYRAKLAHCRSVIFDKDEEIDSILSEGPLEVTISRLARALKR